MLGMLCIYSIISSSVKGNCRMQCSELTHYFAWTS